ncbi:tetratricopeptide repeat protein [Piscinibacter terrae]|uniref:Response regulator n=1 Tax=Piscinibacter terrae TaxID=2496871 RepID=A0A3N7JV46_9BURK|nr:tetratricopeptide repeat protein [Albitalea terrae]RQP22785.1 response regulator [Albitalea terrae]
MKAPATRPVSSFKVLVIDDQQQMRQIIRESLYRLGIRNVVMAGNAKEAVKAMQLENVDVVLSDYNLGEGTDGQQLLELARSTNVLNPTAPWIFITANSLRTDVLSAGDFIPDGYIVKPFTDQLLARYIETLSARKAALAPLLHAIDAKKWDEVLKVAAGFIERRDSLSVEGLKQKANAFMKLGRFDEAQATYGQVLALNSELPWAVLGNANALRALGRIDEARQSLEGLIETHADYAAAYDALLEIAEEQGDQEAALETARAVAEVVPNARRKFRLGAVALDAGKADVAVKALEAAVAKNKGSVTRSHEENVLLAQAHLDNGDAKKALAVATDAAKQYADHPVAQVLTKAVCAQVHQHTGNVEEAKKLMTEVERGLQVTPLPDANKLLVAKSALATGRLELGQGLIEAVARANTDKPLVLNAALRAAQGTPVEAACQDIVAKAGAEVQQVLQDLQAAKRNADFVKAIELGESALAVSPSNFHIQIELCTLYLVAIGRVAGGAEHAARAQDLLQELDSKHPNHTRVAAARKFYRERVAASGALQ